MHVKENENIAGLLFIVECGGGAPGQSELLYRLIAEIAAKKPVIVQVVDVAGSGGYLMICPATAIVAPAMADLGCIGVRRTVAKFFPEKFDHEDESGAMEVHPFAAGKYKSIHNPHAPLTEEEKAQVQHEMDAVYDAFIQLVAHARGLDPAEKDNWAEGKCFTGVEALNLHLIDYIGGFDTALAVLKQELNKRNTPTERLQFIHLNVNC